MQKNHITSTKSVDPCSQHRDGDPASVCHLAQTPVLLILQKPQGRLPQGFPLFCNRLTPPPGCLSLLRHHVTQTVPVPPVRGCPSGLGEEP